MTELLPPIVSTEPIVSMVPLSISDIIQLIGILVALLVGTISIIISVVTLRQNSRIVKESNKAQIDIFPISMGDDMVPSIRIQNFGKSPARIINITTDNDEINSSECLTINPFPLYINCIIATKQTYQSVFCCDNGDLDVPYDKFSVTITYETLGDIVCTTHFINFDFLEAKTRLYPTNSRDGIEILNKINKNIHLLVQK